MTMTVIITGFGPFPGAPSNPTGPLAQALARRRRPAFAGLRRISHVFDTSYASIERDLPALLAEHRPTALLMFGLAAKTRQLRIETRARNVASSLFPDATRRKPAGRRLTQDAPALRRANAPVVRLWSAARKTGVPARLSRDAGGYLCNALFWRALEASSRHGGPGLVAFVHVPSLGRHFSAEGLLRAGEEILLSILAAGRHLG